MWSTPIAHGAGIGHARGRNFVNLRQPPELAALVLTRLWHLSGVCQRRLYISRQVQDDGLLRLSLPRRLLLLLPLVLLMQWCVRAIL